MKTDSLYNHAIAAEKNLEQLATGLSQAGADPQAIQTVTRMADVARKIASTLAKGGTEDEPEPEARPTIDSATEEMMASRRANPQGGPTQ